MDVNIFLGVVFFSLHTSLTLDPDSDAMLREGFDHALAGRRVAAEDAFARAIAAEPHGTSAREAHQQLAQYYFEDFKNGNASARHRAEWHFARYFEGEVPKTLLQWYNFHGSWEELKAKLGEELEAIATSPFGDFSGRMLLARHVEILRRRERDPEWLASHFVNCHKLMKDLGVDAPDACAYGTTWLHSFLKVLTVAEVSRLLSGSKPLVVVLGSALGYQCSWLVALFPSVQCIGYDNLCGLVEDAQKIWSEAVEDDIEVLDKVHFECRDAIGQEPWWNEGRWGVGNRSASGLLVWANDYAWGAEARRRLLEKLNDATNDAGVPAMVVLPSSRVLQSLDTKELPLMSELLPFGWQRVADLEIPVSWHEALPLVVLERHSSERGPGSDAMPNGGKLEM